uniref:Uncharacterized protein n=2 Tax=Leptocylindrus danicus TaxID=163516 RepID=A0A7S2LLS0_9STRA|mmetsp:Transcript_6534/g.9652  ORF Transcript_6534/g.9652 Transcript_6534/m.9652 type:complete len:178 (+) Transcript_6534:647-1180(+)
MGGNTGELPPVEPASLSPKDVYCLVDIDYDNKPFISAAARLDEDGTNLKGGSFGLSFSKFESSGPVEVTLKSDGTFGLLENPFTAKIHFLRATDNRIICVSNAVSVEQWPESRAFYDDTVPPDEVASMVSFEIVSESTFGNVPTLLSSRIGPDSEQRIDFRFIGPMEDEFSDATFTF